MRWLALLVLVAGCDAEMVEPSPVPRASFVSVTVNACPDTATAEESCVEPVQDSLMVGTMYIARLAWRGAPYLVGALEWPYVEQRYCPWRTDDGTRCFSWGAWGAYDTGKADTVTITEIVVFSPVIADTHWLQFALVDSPHPPATTYAVWKYEFQVAGTQPD